MADVNSRLQRSELLRSAPSDAPEPARVGESGLVAMVELLFFAYRDFVAGPDEILAELGFGRAHHRILHFVNS